MMMLKVILVMLLCVPLLYLSLHLAGKLIDQFKQYLK